MRIAIHSASAAVRRILEQAITQSGHQVSADQTTSDVLIEDTIHPIKPSFAYPLTLKLVKEGAAENALRCPLHPHNLVQRLTMLSSTQTIPLGNGWGLDMQARLLIHAQASAPLSLTEKECALLKYLAISHPTPLNRDDLLEHVWGVAGDVDTHTLETHIYRLRAKLEPLSPSPCDILTQGGAYTLLMND